MGVLQKFRKHSSGGKGNFIVSRSFFYRLLLNSQKESGSISKRISQRVTEAVADYNLMYWYSRHAV